MDDRTHPFLQQVPLTVSPFINLPSATTLPYTYKPMPSTLPPSVIIPAPTDLPASNPSPSNPTSSNLESTASKPKYVISPSGSGHAAHPDDILASCRALNAHITELQARAEAEIAAVEERIRQRELAEKRRVAPGWLDSEARMLEPERKGGDEAGMGFGREDGEGRDADASAEMGDTGTWGSGGGSGAGGQFGFGGGYGQNGHGPGGASEMAVPDEGEQLDRAFASLQLKP